MFYAYGLHGYIKSSSWIHVMYFFICLKVTSWELEHCKTGASEVTLRIWANSVGANAQQKNNKAKTV